MTEFKKGDRVRVTFEGEVTHTGSPSGNIRITPARGEFAWVQPKHIEKLADPEPEWVNGDVVQATKIATPPRIRLQGQWYWQGTGLQSAIDDEFWSEEWRAGRVRILYKADA